MTSPISLKYGFNADGSVTVQVWIAQGTLTDVESADLTLTYDSTAATFDAATPPAGWVQAVNSLTAGTVKIAQFDISSGFTAPLGGSSATLLGSYNFTPAAGETSFTVNLTQALLGNGTSTTVYNGATATTPITTTDPMTAVIPLTANATITATTPTVTDVAQGQTETVTFQVTLSQPLLQAATIAYTVAGTSANPATASDFLGGVLPSGILTFNPLQTTQTVTLTLAGTNAVDFNHAFTVTLGSPSNGVLISPATDSATETVLNTNTSKASISATNAVQTESGTGTTPLTFTVTLDQAPVVAQTLTYNVVAGAGASAADFAGDTLPTGTVTFAAGQTTATITVNAQNSNIIQSDAAFSVVLSNPSSQITVASSTAEGDILDGTGSSVLVYDWKSHDLLSGVTLQATAVDTTTSALPQALSLQNVHLDASGNLVAELYGNAGTGAGSFDANFTLPTDVSASFASALSGWAVTQNAATAGSPSYGSRHLGGAEYLQASRFALVGPAVRIGPDQARTRSARWAQRVADFDRGRPRLCAQARTLHAECGSSIAGRH